MGIVLHFNASVKEQMTPAARRKLLSALQSLPALSGVEVKPLKVDSDPCVFASVVVDGTRDSVAEIWKALVDWAKASKTLIELPQSGTIVDLKRPGRIPPGFDGPVQDPRTKPAKSLPPRLVYNQAEFVSILEARLANLPRPKRNNPSPREVKSTMVREWGYALCNEFLQGLGFRQTPKGHFVRELNNVVQEISYGAFKWWFNGYLRVGFQSALTGKREVLWSEITSQLGPGGSHLFNLSVDLFEYDMLESFIYLIRYGIPLLEEMVSVEKYLEMEKEGRVRRLGQSDRWRTYEQALISAHLGNLKEARAGLTKALAMPGQNREALKEFRQQVTAALERLDKLEKTPLPRGRGTVNEVGITRKQTTSDTLPAPTSAAKARTKSSPVATPLRPASEKPSPQILWPEDRLRALPGLADNRRNRALYDLFLEFGNQVLTPVNFVRQDLKFVRQHGNVRQEVFLQVLRRQWNLYLDMHLGEASIPVFSGPQQDLDGDTVPFLSIARGTFAQTWKSCMGRFLEKTLPMLESCHSLDGILKAYEQGILPVQAYPGEDIPGRAAALYKLAGRKPRKPKGLVATGSEAEPDHAVTTVGLPQKSRKRDPHIPQKEEPALETKPAITKRSSLAARLKALEASWPNETLRAMIKMTPQQRGRVLGDLFLEFGKRFLRPLDFQCNPNNFEFTRTLGSMKQSVSLRVLSAGDGFGLALGLDSINPDMPVFWGRQDALDGDAYAFRSLTPKYVEENWKSSLRQFLTKTLPLLDRCDSIGAALKAYEEGILPVQSEPLEVIPLRAALLHLALGQTDRARACLLEAKHEVKQSLAWRKKVQKNKTTKGNPPPGPYRGSSTVAREIELLLKELDG